MKKLKDEDIAIIDKDSILDSEIAKIGEYPYMALLGIAEKRIRTASDILRYMTSKNNGVSRWGVKNIPNFVHGLYIPPPLAHTLNVLLEDVFSFEKCNTMTMIKNF